MNDLAAERARRLRTVARMWLVGGLLAVAVAVVAYILRGAHNPCGDTWSLGGQTCAALSGDAASSYHTWSKVCSIAVVIALACGASGLALRRAARRAAG